MIRDSIDRVITKRADTAKDVFQMSADDVVDKLIVPYAPLAGQAADFITTTIGLRREGVIEGNPMMKSIVKSLPLFAVLKLGVGLASCVTIRKLQDAGRPNAAKVFSVLSTIVGAGPAINNIIVMNNQKS